MPPEEEFSIREMLKVLLGTEGKRKLRNQRKTNDELFSDFEALAFSLVPSRAICPRFTIP